MSKGRESPQSTGYRLGHLGTDTRAEVTEMLVIEQKHWAGSLGAGGPSLLSHHPRAKLGCN